MSSNPTKNAEPTKPWYKQFWPWFIIALPATSVVAGLTTVAIAVKNQDSVVRDDWYKDGKFINATFERDRKATELGVAADIQVDDLTGEVLVSLSAKENVAPATLTLLFAHPTQSERDQTIALTRQTDGRYHGLIANALEGRYYVDLSDPTWHLQGMETFPQKSITLRAVTP